MSHVLSDSYKYFNHISDKTMIDRRGKSAEQLITADYLVMQFFTLTKFYGELFINEEEKILTSETSQEGDTTDTGFDPVQAINELKQNSVSKEAYNKVVEEKNKYLKALIDGNQVAEAKQEKPVDISELRNDLFSGKKDLSNLEYAQKALELRNAIIDKEGKDIFVGRGSKLTPTNEDYEAAQKVADTFQQCIDVAQGDSEIFTRELMRLTEDVSPLTAGSRIDPRIRR